MFILINVFKSDIVKIRKFYASEEIMDILDLSVLTEKQRQAFLMKQKGLTFAQMGKEMGTTAHSARQLFMNAERRLKAHEEYVDQLAKDSEKIELPITIGELKIIIEALEMLHFQRRPWAKDNSKDWIARKQHQFLLLDGLLQRFQNML